MARVLVINMPYVAKGMPHILPMQVALLGSYLKDRGHEAAAIDLNVAPKERMRELVRDGGFDLVGVCYRNAEPAYWVEHFKGLRSFILELCELGVDPLMGGPAFSLYAPLIFKHVPEITRGVLGEGEDAIARIAAGEPLDAIPGATFRAPNGEIRRNFPPRYLSGAEIPKFQDIEEFDFAHPAYLAGLQSYRGCEYDCGFCPTAFMRGDGVRLRPLADVEHDVLFLASKGFKHLMLVDGVANEPTARSLELLDLFKRIGQPETWEGFFKPTRTMTEEYVSRLKESGLVRCHIDIMSAAPNVARRIGHGVTIDEAERVAALLKANGIEGSHYFAYMLPKERFWDEIAGYFHIHRIRKTGQKAYTWPYLPYPGTRFEREYFGDILQKGFLWHVWRTLRMLMRPSFLKFLISSKTALYWTGPKKDPTAEQAAG